MRLSRTPLLLALACPLWLAACSEPAPPAARTPPTAEAAPATTIPSTRPTPGDEVPASGMSPDSVSAGAEADAAPAAPADATVPAPASEGEGEGDARARIERLLGDADQYETLFNNLQRGVAANDAAAVAALMRYPLNVHVGGNKRSVADAATFQREYSQIITPAIAKVIAGEKFDRLFVNGQGVMLGSGQVWMNGKCLDKECSKADAKVITVQD